MGLWEFGNLIDVNNIQSNNVREILDVYGVEAARMTIVKEIDKVFAVYGISVDLRHLFLIADYMVAIFFFPFHPFILFIC
jgi:DNA-directed RNA polymerase I subunit RPA1